MKIFLIIVTARSNLMFVRYPEKKLTIIGCGIISALEAYFAWQSAKACGEQIRISMYDKNQDISETTVSHLVPSLTPDEILAVVPRGDELLEKLGFLFSEPGGIRVDDVNGVMNDQALDFIEQVRQSGSDEEGHLARTQNLLALGKKSMELWQKIYADGDDELKQIMEESNFNPCKELENDELALHRGYRIDLIYNVINAKQKAQRMQQDYEALGYQHCQLLSPEEVMVLDPFLIDFCLSHSAKDPETNKLIWQDDAVALYRPGGCLDTKTFLPKFYEYLRKQMGTYINADGKIKDCFRLKFNKHVTGVIYDEQSNHPRIHGLRLFDKTKINKHEYKESDYVFCPGESVGTLEKLGFNEPARAGFAGASLMLEIPLTIEKIEQYSQFNHCMEVHQTGVVLAWQARLKENKIVIGVAGTKAFYGDQKPNENQAFAKDRNLLQLNMINDVLPEFISLALQRDTKGQTLDEADLTSLENNGIAIRWAGVRSVAYDNVPTLGSVYPIDKEEVIENARCTTHAGSGGVSFAPAVVEVSRGDDQSEIAKTALHFGNSLR